MAFQHRRFYILTGPGSGGSPTAGGEIDGVAREGPDFPADPGPEDYKIAHGPGTRALVEAGGAFSADTGLATDGQGRAVAAQAGDLRVARALDGASGAGDVVTVVLTSQREV